MRISDWSSDVCSSDLGADEQHLAARCHRRGDEIERTREQRHGLQQIDDVNAVAVAEDIRLHLRVPAVRLVAEVRAGFEQLLHGDDRSRHRVFPFRLFLRSEEHTSELQSLMRISYAVFCLTKKNTITYTTEYHKH